MTEERNTRSGALAVATVFTGVAIIELSVCGYCGYECCASIRHHCPYMLLRQSKRGAGVRKIGVQGRFRIPTNLDRGTRAAAGPFIQLSNSMSAAGGWTIGRNMEEPTTIQHSARKEREGHGVRTNSGNNRCVEGKVPTVILDATL